MILGIKPRRASRLGKLSQQSVSKVDGMVPPDSRDPSIHGLQRGRHFYDAERVLTKGMNYSGGGYKGTQGQSNTMYNGIPLRNIGSNPHRFIQPGEIEIGNYVSDIGSGVFLPGEHDRNGGRAKGAGVFIPGQGVKEDVAKIVKAIPKIAKSKLDEPPLKALRKEAKMLVRKADRVGKRLGKRVFSGGKLPVESMSRFVVSNVIPTIMRDLGIKKSAIPLKQIRSYIRSSASSLGSVAHPRQFASQVVNPIISATVANVTRGHPLPKNAISALKKHGGRLRKHMAAGLVKALYYSHKKMKGGRLVMSGGADKKKKLSGFQKFGRVFTKHIWPLLTKENLSKAASLGAMAATSLGHPEIGLTLEGISKVLAL